MLMLFLAQITLWGQYENGSSYKFKVLSNNPNVQSKWSINGGIKAAYNQKYLIPSLALNGQCMLGDNTELKASFIYGFPINISDNDGSDAEDLLKSHAGAFRHYTLDAAFSIYESPISLNGNIRMGAEGYDRGVVTYYLHKKLNYLYNVRFTAGVGSLRHRISVDHPELIQTWSYTPPGTEVTYRAVNFGSANIRLGLEFNWETFVLSNIDSRLVPQYQKTSLFGQLLVPVYKDLTVVRYTQNQYALGVPAKGGEVEDGYEPVEFSSLGFIAGIELKGLWNPAYSRVNFRVEGGILPGLKDANNLYLALGIQVGIGSDMIHTLEKVEHKDYH